MPYQEFDRRKLHLKPLSDRQNKIHIEQSHVKIDAVPETLDPIATEIIQELVDRLKSARANNKSRMLVFGAHTIKNGLSPVIVRLLETSWITHIATNGAGIIHDWEFAYQGASSEDVRENMVKGEFGTWQETGYYLNLALLLGAYNNMGYGESIGSMVEDERILIPERGELEAAITPSSPNASSAHDLLQALDAFKIDSGEMSIPHPFKQYGLQSAAYRLKIPFTGHPMFGHDIHYTHPLNSGAAVGRTAEFDFLRYADSVANLEGGAYISIGSAVMSPMVFEKSLSMARNVALQNNQTIDNQLMVVVDLAKSHWDWTQGEPPEDNPDYYMRYNKTFSRMGGTLRYLSADNRDFLLTLLHTLEKTPE